MSEMLIVDESLDSEEGHCQILVEDSTNITAAHKLTVLDTEDQ